MHRDVVQVRGFRLQLRPLGRRETHHTVVTRRRFWWRDVQLRRYAADGRAFGAGDGDISRVRSKHIRHGQQDGPRQQNSAPYSSVSRSRAVGRGARNQPFGMRRASRRAITIRRSGSRLRGLSRSAAADPACRGPWRS
jgi:hypothetical protein